MTVTNRQYALLGLGVGGFLLLLAMASDPIVYETEMRCVDTFRGPNCTQHEVPRVSRFYQFSLYGGGLMFSISLTWMVISSAVRAGMSDR